MPDCFPPQKYEAQEGFPSPQQMQKVQALALDWRRIEVEPNEDARTVTIKNSQTYESLIFDAAGNVVDEPPTHAFMAVRIDLLREMLGDGVVDAALMRAGRTSFRDHTVGTNLRGPFEVALRSLLAKRDLVQSVVG